MDETQDLKPHPQVDAVPEESGGEMSIWFFVGILTLVYGVVLLIQGAIEYSKPPANELLLPFLIPLHPTLYWGLVMFLFGAFYTIKFRPGKG